MGIGLHGSLPGLAGQFGAGAIYLIASGKADFDLVKSGLAFNGFGAHSPGNYSLGAGFVAEVVLTFMFLLVIFGATDRAPRRALRRLLLVWDSH